MVGACLKSARPSEVAGDRLTIEFPSDCGFACKTAEKNRELVQMAIATVTGARIGVRCELTDVPLGDAQEGGETLSEDELIALLEERFGAKEVFDD
jgi:hypothetical protein